MTSMAHEDLRADEVDLRGQWMATKKGIEGDAICARIKWLIAERLERLGSDSTGWETLYRDPRDGRLWEHTYPQSEMHGGGPPQLRLTPPEEAAQKYGWRGV